MDTPNPPSTDEREARALFAAGDFEAAGAACSRGLATNPGDLGLITLQGFCLLRLRRFEDAYRTFLTVLRADRDVVDAHYGFALTLEALGDADGATREFQFTIELDPRHPAALAVLAARTQLDGDALQARRLAERALAVEPLQWSANLVLARMELAELAFGKAEARLRDVLAAAHEDGRSALLSALGDALDGQGRFRDAFSAYEAANAIARSSARLTLADEGDAGLDAVAEALRHYEAAPPRRPTGSPASDASAPRVHAFLVGFPRSGTTLLEQVLASHPDVVTLSERRALPPAGHFEADADGYVRLASLDPATAREHRAAYWANVRSHGVEPLGKVFIDKFPLNTLRLPLIAALFPEARILFAIRDPRDVVLSGFRRSFEMNAGMYQLLSVDSAARFYDLVMRFGRIARERSGLAWRDTRYERLVEDFDAELHEVCAFLDLGYDAQMADFAVRARTRRIVTPSGPQVTRGLYRDALAHWRNYDWALAPASPMLQPWIDRFGYERA